MTWRVLMPEVNRVPAECEGGEASWNMALDEALLHAVTVNVAPPTLRLYYWEQPALTLGRFQNVERGIWREACREKDVPLVRRITGGRGILHGDDLTISVVASLDALGFTGSEPTSAAAIYRRIAAGFLGALSLCGIPAQMGLCERERRLEGRGDCFEAISQADVVDARTGEKRLGAALHRRDRWVLLQASLPLNTPEQNERMRQLRAAVFVVSEKKKAQSNAPGLPIMELCRTLIEAFADVFGGPGVSEEVTERERSDALRLASYRYSLSDWTETGKS